MAIFLIYITYSMNTVTSEFVKYDFDFIFSMSGVIKQILLLPKFTNSNSFFVSVIASIPFIIFCLAVSVSYQELVPM